MTNASQMVDEIISTILKLVNKNISQASFDVTKKGFISAVNDGVYSVKIGNEIYPIKSNTTYTVGDTVYVLFVQNDPKNKFILGKAV